MKTRLLVALTLALAASLANAGPGQVLVVFKIESGQFKSNLKADVGPTEASLANALKDQLQAQFPPLEFMTAAPPDGPAATFTASLKEDDSSTPNIGIPNIGIHWSAKIGTADLPMRDLQDWPVYESRNPVRPYRNAPKLIQEVTAKIAKWLQSDAIGPKVHDDFVRHVPLATRVEFDDSLQAILIPLPWLRAQLSRNSTFRLEFTRATPLSEMTIVLNRVARRLDDPLQGDTQSRINSCEASGAPVDGDLWAACIGILKQHNPPPLLVRIEHYEYEAQLPDVVSGGTAVRP